MIDPVGLGSSWRAACYHRRAAHVAWEKLKGKNSVREVFGMSPEEMDAYINELLEREAEESAAARDTTVEEELASPGFAAARVAASYTIHLINANNQFIARYLLDHGVLPGANTEPAAAADATHPGE